MATTRAKAARVECKWIEACFAPSVVSRFSIISLLFSFFVGWTVASGSMYVDHFCLSVRWASRAESLPTRANSRFPANLSSLAQDGQQAHDPKAGVGFVSGFGLSIKPIVSLVYTLLILGCLLWRVQGPRRKLLLRLVFFP